MSCDLARAARFFATVGLTQVDGLRHAPPMLVVACDLPQAMRREVAMSRETIHGHWREMKGAALESWGRITHDPWIRLAGRRERAMGRLEASLDVSRLAALMSVRGSRRFGTRRD